MGVGVQALQEYEVKKGTIANVSVDCRGWLDGEELLTGVPTVASTAGLTFANQAVSVAELTINGQDVPIGKAVQFKVDTTSATVGEYTITITASTDSTPAQTRLVELGLTVVA
jgi:uncharacterized membrane protein